MKKIRITERLWVPGIAEYSKGEEFEVVRQNNRFTYVMIDNREYRIANKYVEPVWQKEQ